MDLNNIFNKDFQGLVNKIGLHLLEQISTDYKIELSELKEKYLQKKVSITNKRYKKPSGYSLFCADIDIDKEIRDFLHTEFPELTKINNLVFKEKGRRWKELTVKQKEKWNDMAKTME